MRGSLLDGLDSTAEQEGVPSNKQEGPSLDQMYGGRDKDVSGYNE